LKRTCTAMVCDGPQGWRECHGLKAQGGDLCGSHTKDAIRRFRKGATVHGISIVLGCPMPHVDFVLKRWAANGAPVQGHKRRRGVTRG
jgi:hypothetical protein